MSRGLLNGLLLALVAASGLDHLRAAGRDAESSRQVLEQFLTIDNATPTQHRVLRRLDATTQRFVSPAWMDVWTEADSSGFRYHVAAEGGSESIRNRVFRSLLEKERRAWTPGRPNPAGLTPLNYSFGDVVAPADGLAKLGVTALRNDVLLINGNIFLKPQTGDLVRVEGRLAKSPSFWTRRVDIVRHYERLHGVRLPVSLESVADVKIYGRSTLTMTYEYESVNGQRVGSPQLRAAGVSVQ